MLLLFFCFFKQKTAYEMRISDWSSDVFSSDLRSRSPCWLTHRRRPRPMVWRRSRSVPISRRAQIWNTLGLSQPSFRAEWEKMNLSFVSKRSEEHTSELQSLMRISYAVFCLKKKITYEHIHSAQLNIKKIE